MIKLLKQFTSKRFLTRVCLVLGVIVFVGVLFPEATYAQNILTEAQRDSYNVLSMLVSFLSWLWIIPAYLAGVLMSNTLAFGAEFYLDRYLFTMWQLMRTFSLFALGFIFIGAILKNYITFGEVKKYGEIIKKTIVAGLLISMSWYVLVAIVDLSIVATSAVAGVPLVVMADQYKSMEKKIYCYDTITVKKFGALDQLDIATSGNKNPLTLEQIMPEGDNVSGPLVFLGCGILNLSDSSKLPEGAKVSTTLFIKHGIKLIVGVMIILPMIILMVVNMMRIFFLWLWAMFAPIIALDIVWKGPLTKDGSPVAKYFSPKNILGLVFQPVAVVACMSIAIIMILGLYDSQIGGQTFKEKSMEETFQVYSLSDDRSKVGTGALNESFINGTILEKTGNWIGGVVGELIMAIFTIILLWTLVKVGFSASEITKGVSDKMYNFGKELAKSVPIVPTSFGPMSIGALQKGKDELKRGITRTMRRKQSMQADKLAELTGLNKGDSLTNSEIAQIQNEADAATTNSDSNATKFLTAVKNIQSNKPIRTGNAQFRSATETWLKKGGLQYISRNPRYSFNVQAVMNNIGDIWEGSGDNETVRRFLDSFLSSTDNDFAGLSGGNATLRSTYNKTGT